MQIANDFSNHSSITKFSITRISFNHKFFIKKRPNLGHLQDQNKTKTRVRLEKL